MVMVEPSPWELRFLHQGLSPFQPTMTLETHDPLFCFKISLLKDAPYSMHLQVALSPSPFQSTAKIIVLFVRLGDQLWTLQKRQRKKWEEPVLLKQDELVLSQP